MAQVGGLPFLRPTRTQLLFCGVPQHCQSRQSKFFIFKCALCTRSNRRVPNPEYFNRNLMRLECKANIIRYPCKNRSKGGPDLLIVASAVAEVFLRRAAPAQAVQHDPVSTVEVCLTHRPKRYRLFMPVD